MGDENRQNAELNINHQPGEAEREIEREREVPRPESNEPLDDVEGTNEGHRESTV